MTDDRMTNDGVYLAALAGLLHDVGKFGQRAGWQKGKHAEVGAKWVEQQRDLFPREMWEDLADAVAEHHARTPRKRLTRIVQLADWMAAGERYTEKNIQRAEPETTPLVPILSRVELAHPRPEEAWGFDLAVLGLDTLFPKSGLTVLNASRYPDLWPLFEKDIGKLKLAGLVSDGRHFISLLSLLRKYLALMPSATPWEKGDEDEERTLPDISLYDHLKVTAAIAACLERGLTDDEVDRLLRWEETAWREPVAAMVRGDLSGIQDFIYRITRPAGDAAFRGVAKRLRGRSFYLALLGDVVGDWLVRRLGLTAANLLFCGGGRFDLLIPRDSHSQQELARCLEELEDWLLDTFYGELGIQFARQDVTPADFGDMREVYRGLEHSLESSKARKWGRWMLRDDFHTPSTEAYHACPVCHITPRDEPDRPCKLCDQHHDIGSHLPDTQWLALAYDTPTVPAGAVAVSFPRFETTVLLLNDDQATTFQAHQRQRPTPAVLYRLNDTGFIPDNAPAGLGLGFRFLANTAPVALKTIQLPDHEPTARGDVLDFEEMAELSAGAKRLGVLKADVDYLGLLFSDGLEPPTISRQAALSHAVDLFFAGWINRVCDNVFTEWKKGPGESWQDQISNLFYVLYSGGDDLFIVGPWDQTLELARQLQADFAEYACRNPNVTLSAGSILVKPHYPVQRFAHLVSRQLGDAKDAGRNRISVFSQAVEWCDEQPGKGFAWCLEFAKGLRQKVESGEHEMPRTLIHDLGRLYRKNQIKRDHRLKPMWVPEVYYTLARRLKKEVRESVQENILAAFMGHTILIPVSYVSLITRKE